MTISLRSTPREILKRASKKIGSRAGKRGSSLRQTLQDTAGHMLPTSGRGALKSAKISLSQASKRVGSAAKDLVAWGRSNPVKAAAAATALAAVSAFLYAAHGRNAKSTKKI